ncbi:hypothetical protein U1Q18_007723 [Sarracenia purpurea var. burkii]
MHFLHRLRPFLDQFRLWPALETVFAQHAEKMKATSHQWNYCFQKRTCSERVLLELPDMGKFGSKSIGNFSFPHQIQKEHETCCTVGRTFASVFLPKHYLTCCEPHTLYVVGDSVSHLADLPGSYLPDTPDIRCYCHHLGIQIRLSYWALTQAPLNNPSCHPVSTNGFHHL